ncbi:restriction endonuclease subunit S [Achromobacter sp. F4_2707]|uniref:restriction endonuclease subunit S n=1 Tax=Achromobacter sp. F4_2707 TaxID=3114286 RepID=UPI0039C71F7D
MEREVLWDIPQSWTWATISDLGEVVGGGTPPTKEPTYWGGDINWISPADLTGHTKKIISKGSKSITEDGLKNSSARVMPAGSVHFSSRAPIGYVVISTEPMATNQGFKNLVPEQGIFNEFVYYYLKASKQLAEKRASGTTFLELSGKAFGLLPIPLPPSNEQKRIVAKIEELFSELDNGIAALKTAREQLKVYRQAVLKHAFEGKLTAQWRKDNAHKLESPEQLLARIQQEREARYQQQLEKWKAAVKAWEDGGKEGKKPSKPSKLSEIKPASTTDFDTPAEWTVSELGLIAYENVLGKMLDRKKNIGEERPYLGNINVRWGAFEIDELKTMRIEESEVDRYSLRFGDLVICEGGEPGRCAVWSSNNDKFFIQKALHRVRFTQSYLPEFAFYYFSYAVSLERVVKHFTGTTIKHLTGSGLSKVQLPVCSVAEQKEIINIVESNLTNIDTLTTELDIQLAKAEALRQSILKKAFSGQLVPQDPSEEPASELLARIQAERNAKKTSNTRKVK